MQVLQKLYKNAICVTLLSAAILTMIIAVGYYFGGEVGFDGMINGGYMNIGNSYAAAAGEESDLLITPAGHLSDNASMLLIRTAGVDIFNMTDNNNMISTYAIVTSYDVSNKGFQIINVTDPYRPLLAGSGTDGEDGYSELEGAYDVDTFEIDDDMYAIVVATGDHGFQIINMTDPDNPLPAGSGTDGEDGYDELEGASGVDTFEIDDDMYAIVVAIDNHGFQIINMTDPDNPLPAGSGTDSDDADGYDELEGAYGVDTFEIDDDMYAIVASFSDNGFQIINMTDPNNPLPAGSGTDSDDADGYSTLEDAFGVDTFKIDDDMYAIVTSFEDNGFQIINVTDPDNPSPAGSGTDSDDADGYSELDRASGVATFEIGDTPYAIVAGFRDNGFQIINMTDPDNPLPAGSGTDDADGYRELLGTSGVDTFAVASDDYTYAIFTSSLTGDGIQIIRIADRDSDTISPSLRTNPVLNLDSRTLSFNFTETIDVSEINMSSISILDKNYAYITSLDDGSKIKSTDSYKFTITLAGAPYRSILAEAASGDNMLYINVTGTAIPDFAENYAEFTAKLDVVMPKPGDLLIIPASSITDNSTLALEDAYGVDIFYIDDNPYAVVASHVGGSDGGIQIINMTDPYYPKALANVTYTDDNPTALVDAIGVATFDMDANKYAIVTSRNSTNISERGSIQIIDVTNPDAPVVKGNLTDNEPGDSVFSWWSIRC